jgi:hypothetical protein
MAVRRTILLYFAVLVFHAAATSAGPARETAVTINVDAFNFASQLIKQGRFVADKKGAWSSDHPARSQQNAFVRDQGFSEYAKWHLAVDDRKAFDSKARYKFPFGDFQSVHRCGLLAAKSRAREYGYREIEAAAAKLLKMIDSARPRAQKHVD